MPFLRVTTDTVLEEAQKTALLEKLETIIPILPGKTRDNAMLAVEGGCRMSMGGEGGCAFVDVRLYRQSPLEAKCAFTKALTELLCAELGVKAGRVYLNLVELPEWGAGGSYK